MPGNRSCLKLLLRHVAMSAVVVCLLASFSASAHRGHENGRLFDRGGATRQAEGHVVAAVGGEAISQAGATRPCPGGSGGAFCCCALRGCTGNGETPVVCAGGLSVPAALLAARAARLSARAVRPSLRSLPPSPPRGPPPSP